MTEIDDNIEYKPRNLKRLISLKILVFLFMLGCACCVSAVLGGFSMCQMAGIFLPESIFAYIEIGDFVNIGATGGFIAPLFLSRRLYRRLMAINFS